MPHYRFIRFASDLHNGFPQLPRVWTRPDAASAGSPSGMCEFTQETHSGDIGNISKYNEHFAPKTFGTLSALMARNMQSSLVRRASFVACE
jgi:hypothetical protein